MTNIAELLKDAPKGIKLYSPLLGEVILKRVAPHSEHIIVKSGNYSCSHEFYKDGRYFDYPYSECLLFPSKDCRTWEGWKVPKPHYDIANFHAGMPVLVRDEDSDDDEWTYALFSHYSSNRTAYKFSASGEIFRQCIPFNEETKHLLGTTDMCDKQYINW